MNVQPFSDGAILKAAWQRVKDRLGFIIILGIVLAVYFIAGSSITGWIASESDWGFIVAELIYIILSMVIGIGMIRIYLDLADGKDGSLVDLVKHWNLLLKYIGVSIVYGIVVLVGYLLLVFPGVIWGLKFHFAPWLVIDKGMGPIEAMKVSSQMTMGMKWDLLGFHVVVSVVMAIGFVLLGVGMIVTMPLGMIATAMLYRHLSQGAATPAQPASVV